MFEILLAILGVGLVLVISEYFWNLRKSHGEIARKFVHIIAGTFMASWALFLDVRQIQILSVILLAGVLLSKYWSIFRSVHSISRKTWGEAFFALSIGVSATLAPNKWIYAAAVLHVSLADGLAAVIGTKFGKRTGYTILGQHKTLVGTAAFYVTSACITAWLITQGGAGIDTQAWAVVLWLPLLTAITENLGVSGIDNIAIPLVVIGALNLV